MSPPGVSQNKRRTREDDPETDESPNGSTSRKRRAFLQTMGQQLRQFGPQESSPQDQSRSTFGTSPNAHFLPPTPNAARAEEDPVRLAHVDTPESDAVPGEHDQCRIGATKSASKWLWCAGEVVPMSPALSYTFEDVLDWSQSYFDHWHPAFPFIHAPSLLDYFRQITTKAYLNQHNPASLQHTILRSVLSIALLDGRQLSSRIQGVPSVLVFHSFNDAMNSLQRVLVEESSILSLQALVSVQLFLISMLRYNAASRLEGLAVRMAFQLGLHHCPFKLPGVSSKEAELRKRLFWSIFCIDRYICIRLGIPLGIRSEDIDVCYPHAEQHQCVSHTVTDRDERLDLLDFLAHHANIRGSVIDLRRSATLYGGRFIEDSTMKIDADHTKWWNHVEEYLCTKEDASAVNKLHQVTLIVSRFESVIALHRSILATSKRNSAYNSALQRCISASRSIINTLHKALQGFGAYDGSPGHTGYESTPLLWPSFTWAVWMSSFIIMFAATEDQVPRNVALRLADRSIDVLKHLSLRGTNWPEACIVAIQNLAGRLNSRSTRSSTAESGTCVQTTSFIDSSKARSTAPRAMTGVPVPCPTRTEQHHARREKSYLPNQMETIYQDARPSSLAASMLAPPPTANLTPFSRSVHTQNAPTNLDSFTFPESTMHFSETTANHRLASAHLAGAGDFLGIAQQLSDNPIPDSEIMHLFNGDDFDFNTSVDFGLNSTL